MPAYRLEIASRGQAGCNGELSTSWTDRDADQACVWPRSFLGDEVQDQLQATVNVIGARVGDLFVGRIISKLADRFTQLRPETM